jgi:hypothetical protein
MGYRYSHTQQLVSFIYLYCNCCVWLYLYPINIDTKGNRMQNTRIKTLLQVGRSRVRDPMTQMNFSVYLIIPAALGPRFHLASNRNVYKKQKKCFWEVKWGRCVRLTTLPPSVSRLFTQCGIFNISQIYRSLRPVTGIHLLFMKKWLPTSWKWWPMTGPF